MASRKSPLDIFMDKRAFISLLFSQGILNMGDSFRFIALTMLLLKLTGSGMSASLGLLFSALPSVFLSPFAGAIGDMFSSKYLLALIDFIRGVVTFSYIYCNDIKTTLIVLIILSSLDTIYNPARRKFIFEIAGKDGLLNANSILTGLSGAIFFVAPILAGFMIDKYGLLPGFYMGAFFTMTSSLIILFIKTPSKIKNRINSGRLNKKLIPIILDGFSYVKNNKPLTKLIILCVVTSICSVSINMAFYPYSFEVLGLNAKGWSMIVSVYNGTNLLAAFLPVYLLKKTNLKAWDIIYLGFIITALIWVLYGMTPNFFAVLAFQFVEGTLIAVCGILLTTFMQKYAQKSYIARVSGVNDITTALGRLTGMAGAYAIMKIESYKLVFFICPVILLSYILIDFSFKDTYKNDKTGKY